jgi:ligand-binding sensor domain-containing protein/two-component sensor histidine kinase
MQKTNNTNYYIILSLAILLFILACRERHDNGVPFPSDEIGFFQPVKEKIKFSSPRQIEWPANPRYIKPVYRKFNFDKLLISIFDSTGFMSFLKPPIKTYFDFENLPEKTFDNHHLSCKTLKFDSLSLDPPKLIKVGRPHLVNSALGLVYEFGDPLANTRIRSLLNDHTGFLWIATDQHLYRYDGENLELFLSGSMVSNINCMVEDKYGEIWIGTHGNGIIVLDRLSGIFKHLTSAQGLAGNDISRMLKDNKGRIWLTEAFRTSEEGVDIIDEDSLTIRHFGPEQGLSSNNATGIIQDKQGYVWIGNLLGGGVNIVDLEKGKIKYLNKLDGLKTDSVTALLLDSKNRIWISDVYGDIYALDVQQGMISHYYKDQGLKRNSIWSLLQDKMGNIWMGTIGNNEQGNGIEIIDPEKEVTKIINTATGLSANNINAIAEDYHGQIWVASLSGLNMFNKNGNNTGHFGKSQILKLIEDSKGQIWICTENQGIQIFDPANGYARSLTPKQGLGSKRPRNIVEKDGEILITGDGGLDIIDSSQKILEHIGKKEGLTYDQAGVVFKDNQGREWIGSNLGFEGIDLLDEKKATVQHLSIDQGLERSYILDIKQDNRGLIWIAYYTGVIDIIDPLNKTIKYWMNAKDFLHPRSNISLLADEKGNMWIGSDQGICIIDEVGDSLSKISIEQGLISNDILSLKEFAGHIYAGTRTGLSVIPSPGVSSGQNWQIESFGSGEGIRRLENSNATDYITKNGKYIWEDLGITILDNLSGAKTVSETFITGIDILNRPQYFDKHRPSTVLSSVPENVKWDTISGPYEIPLGLRLPFEDNYIQFHFAMAHLGSQDSVQYRYILEGTDKKWSDITYNTTSPNYLNISPGSHTFKVSGKVRNMQWSSPAVCSFIIATPWWQAGWFYLLCLTCVILGFYTFYRFRINQILKVQGIRNRIASDLHDDIGSTLSSISIMSELAKDKSPGATILLNAIGESATSIQESMSDLVWAVNPQNDHFKNMMQRMNQFASKILEAKSISFQFNCDEVIYDERLSMDQRKKVYLFFKEAINNAAKHSGAEKVDVGISSMGKQIILTISDNGKGFNIIGDSAGNGLINLRRRAGELRGRVDIHSEINKGTTIQLAFKIT